MIKATFKNYTLPISVFVFVSFMLTMIQLKVKLPMLLLERLFAGGGWIEILIIASFGAIVSYKMQKPKTSAKWRRISWSIFSIWFFTQLILGIFVSDTFLLTGKLHLPIPAMLISGPIYRGEKSIMTLLFFSTIILTGPAWCSQLCYFGAIDNAFAKGKTSKKPIRNKFLWKNSLLVLVVLGTLLLKLLNASSAVALISGLSFGVVGLLIIGFITRKQKRMVHCSAYCPIGTVVNYLKFINPFRMYIDNNCDTCMACTSKCKYDALNLKNIQNKKPGLGCTYCGDCLSACKTSSIKYKFPGLNSQKSRNLYLFLTVSMYAIFLAMGRI